MNVYGDEDGDSWFATGHITAKEMVTAAMDWEAEVADPIEESEFDLSSHSNYYVVPDPNNDERYLVVDKDHAGAEPMTMIRRK